MANINLVYVTFTKKKKFTNENLIQNLLTKAGLPLEPIQKESSGRPYLPMARQLGWDISLSHSSSYRAAILGQQVKVGIDCEELKTIDLSESLLKLVLSPEEHTKWKTSDSCIEKFYDIWTCKEAISKAVGLGLWLPFEHLNLDFPTESLKKLSLLAKHQQLCWEVLPSFALNFKVSLAVIMNEREEYKVAICRS